MKRTEDFLQRTKTAATWEAEKRVLLVKHESEVEFERNRAQKAEDDLVKRTDATAATWEAEKKALLVSHEYDLEFERNRAQKAEENLLKMTEKTTGTWEAERKILTQNHESELEIERNRAQKAEENFLSKISISESTWETEKNALLANHEAELNLERNRAQKAEANFLKQAAETTWTWEAERNGLLANNEAAKTDLQNQTNAKHEAEISSLVAKHDWAVTLLQEQVDRAEQELRNRTETMFAIEQRYEVEKAELQEGLQLKLEAEKTQRRMSRAKHESDLSQRLEGAQMELEELAEKAEKELEDERLDRERAEQELTFEKEQLAFEKEQAAQQKKEFEKKKVKRQMSMMEFVLEDREHAAKEAAEKAALQSIKTTRACKAAKQLLAQCQESVALIRENEQKRREEFFEGRRPSRRGSGFFGVPGRRPSRGASFLPTVADAMSASSSDSGTGSGAAAPLSPQLQLIQDIFLGGHHEWINRPDPPSKLKVLSQQLDRGTAAVLAEADAVVHPPPEDDVEELLQTLQKEVTSLAAFVRETVAGRVEMVGPVEGSSTQR